MKPCIVVRFVVVQVPVTIPLLLMLLGVDAYTVPGASKRVMDPPCFFRKAVAALLAE